MGYLENVRASAVEQRVIGGVPWRPWDNPYFGLFNTGGPVHPTRSFYGPDEALGLPALYSGVKLLADNAASLPLRIYQNFRQDGYLKHRIYDGPTIFNQGNGQGPSVVGTLFDWICQLMVSVLLQGNAWGYITGKDGYGFPTGIEWIPPQDVYVNEPEDKASWNPLAAEVFVFGRPVRWYGPDAEVFHVRGLPMPGRIEGISPLRAFALTILAGREAQRYGTDWYQAGGFPPGTFQNAEMEVNAQQSAEIRAELVKSLRRREPLVYGRDWDYKPVTVPPSEAQFIDAMQMNATQIAAILCLPPDRIGGSRGDSLTYNTAEQSTLQVIEALRPWLVRFEQAFFRLLPQQRFTKFYTDALLKTDLEARMNIYQTQRNIGFRTADELRELEDLPPLRNGVGAEELPLTTMNAMGTRAGAIPRSFLKSVVLEMDIATDRLIKLEKTYVNQRVPAGGMGQGGNSAGQGGQQGQNGQAAPQQMVTERAPIGQPLTPLPLTQDPASFLASLISVQRDMTIPYEVRDAAQRFWVSILERQDRIRQAEPDIDVPDTDMFAPWVRGREDLREIVLNGQGRH